MSPWETSTTVTVTATATAIANKNNSDSSININYNSNSDRRSNTNNSSTRSLTVVAGVEAVQARKHAEAHGTAYITHPQGLAATIVLDPAGHENHAPGVRNPLNFHS